MQHPTDHRGHDAAVAALSIRRLWRSAAVLLVVLLLMALALALGWQRQVSLGSLLRHRDAAAALVAGHPLTALLAYIGFYAVAAGLALPGVVLLTIAGGVFFGGLLGGFAAVVGASLGASAVFLLAKRALRGPAMRWIGPQAARFADGFRASGFNYLLFIRLVPIFPFSLGNVLPALCGVGLGAFVAATAIGIAPMTLAIAFFGAGLDSALSVEVEEYRACLAAAKQACSLDFRIWTVLTPQLMAGLIALAAAALAPVLLKRYRPLGRG